MKYILSLFTFVFVFCSAVQSQETILPRSNAEASLTKEFDVKASVDKVSKWIESNKDQIYEASGNQVVKDFGDGKVKFSRHTRRGDFIWTVRETTDRSENKIVYKSFLIH